MERLSDELLVIICKFALCPAQGLYLSGEPSFAYPVCNVRCQNRRSIAVGLFLVNRRLSHIALPVLYGENTFCFSTGLRAAIEFFISLPRKNLQQIKRIYFPDKLGPHSEKRSDNPLISDSKWILRHMYLDSFSIAVPHKMQMKIDGEKGYVSSVHGQLSHLAFSMLQDDRLIEVRFVQRALDHPELWQRKTDIFGDGIVTDFVERILLDKETCKDLRERRRSCRTSNHLFPDGDYDMEDVETSRAAGEAAYREMLKSIKNVWESKGVTAMGQNSYLTVKIPVIIIQKLETETKGQTTPASSATVAKADRY